MCFTWLYLVRWVNGRDGPLAEVWEMRGRYLCSMCVRGTELSK